VIRDSELIMKDPKLCRLRKLWTASRQSMCNVRNGGANGYVDSGFCVFGRPRILEKKSATSGDGETGTLPG
jgi:hypothetical protein